MDTLSILFISSLLSFKSDFKDKITTDTVRVSISTLDTAVAKISEQDNYWLLELDSSFYYYCIKDSPGRIKGAIYHELGHVLLNLPHRKGINIMNPDYADLDLYKRRNNKKIRRMYDKS